MKQTIPVNKSLSYTLKITGLGHSGEGVGKYEGFTVFVPEALPGEQVEAKIIEVKKNYAKGKLMRVIEASPDRIEPPCGIYALCGGCQLQHLTYEAQLEVKRRQVADALARIGGQEKLTVHPTLGAENPWHYRNKMQVPAGKEAGKIVLGCYAQGSHAIVDMEHCLIQSDANNTIVKAVKEVLREQNSSIYDERTGAGAVRHVVGRVGTATGEVMAVLVTAVKALPRRDQIVEALKAKIPGLVSIMQNINAKNTNVIMGDETLLLWGRETITDQLGDFTFHISARSFFQVNTKQAEVLYRKAVEYAGLTGEETVIDAYCGTGTISLFLAQKAAKVYGIEIVEPAIRDAKKNALDNQVNNVEFIAGDATVEMPKLYHKGIRPDVIVVDPPRAGCDVKVLETFAAMRPKRIVYVSCNPASLARDIAVLDGLGYAALEVQPVDMFSQTSHVEVICKLIETSLS